MLKTGLYTIVQGWSFYFLVALEYLPNGVCNTTYSGRDEEFGSDDFFDNLCASLGCFYLSEVAFSDPIQDFADFTLIKS